MTEHRPLPRASQATVDAMAESRARAAAFTERGMPTPATRQVWFERDTGVQVRLLGRKTSGWVGLVLGGPSGTGEPVHRTIGLDEHARSWVYVRTDCDHDEACCTEHGTHASPHRECILR